MITAVKIIKRYMTTLTRSCPITCFLVCHPMLLLGLDLRKEFVMFTTKQQEQFSSETKQAQPHC